MSFQSFFTGAGIVLITIALLGGATRILLTDPMAWEARRAHINQLRHNHSLCEQEATRTNAPRSVRRDKIRRCDEKHPTPTYDPKDRSTTWFIGIFSILGFLAFGLAQGTASPPQDSH